MGIEIDTALLQRDIARTGKKLETMAVKVQKVILRKSMRAANAPVVKALKANATKGATRNLSRTMGQQVRTLPTGVVEGTSGQSRAKAKRRGAVHIHLVDQGTRAHVIPGAAFTNSAGELIRGDLDHPGTTGDEFVEHTQKQTSNALLKAFADKTAAEVDAEAAKMGAK